ncbi:MAG TPA: ribonuclease P protein component [Chlamydiales bacterium]|nr:ribonuclease P protein component [Chlamydiales bacterium]
MKFPKRSRLLARRDFQRVAKAGDRRVGKLFCIDCRPAEKARLGISASGKYGSSPERNRFKRLIREAFRLSQNVLPKLELNVIPRQYAKKASCSDVMDELLRLLK